MTLHALPLFVVCDNECIKHKEAQSGNYTKQSVNSNTDCLSICAKTNSKSNHSFANFTIGMIGNETGHLLKQAYRKFITISET